MPTDFSNTIVINREDFLSSLQQASIFVDERTKGVKLVFRDDKLSIFSHSERGRAETQLEVTKQEKELEIAFNIHGLVPSVVCTTKGQNVMQPPSAGEFGVFTGTTARCGSYESENPNPTHE